MLKCKMCIKYEERITSIKGFSQNWIVGTSSVKKDSLEKHIKGDPHKYPADLFNKGSQWGLAVLLTRSLKVLPLDMASLKWQLAIKKSWKIVSKSWNSTS